MFGVCLPLNTNGDKAGTGEALSQILVFTGMAFESQASRLKGKEALSSSGGWISDLELKLSWWHITIQGVTEGSFGWLRDGSEPSVDSRIPSPLLHTLRSESHQYIDHRESLFPTFIIIRKYAHTH